MGYQADVSPIGPDAGIDIILWKNGKKYAVQCKAHQSKVPQSVARDLTGTINNKKNPFDGGFLVCTTGVTSNTREWCEENDITIYTTKELVALNDKYCE